MSNIHYKLNILFHFAYQEGLLFALSQTHLTQQLKHQFEQQH